MRDKITFFVIGAVLSGIAFFAGTYQRNTEPPSELNVKKIECEELRVEDIIWVGKSPGAMIVIDAGGEKSIVEGAEELGSIGLGPNDAAIGISSGITTDILGRDILSQIHLSVSEGVAGIDVDSNFPQGRNPKAGAISINAWNAGAAQLKVKSGNEEQEITVTAE